MRIPQFKRFTEEDFKGIPEWGSRFFQQLNNVLQTHTNALQGGLTMEDNLRAEVIEIDIQDNVTKVIKLNRLKRNPIMGFLGRTNYSEAPDFDWGYSPDKVLSVEVKVKWDNPPDDVVRCTFVFLGGEPDTRATN